MIYFLVTRRNRFPMQNFLRSRGKHFADRITIVYYENLYKIKKLRAGTFIFSNLDLLTLEQREVIKKLYSHLHQRYPQLPLFNDPNKVLLRYDLLKRIYSLGLNRFNVARLTESLESLRFPLFLREADRHTGPLTPIIQNKKDLDRHIRILKFLGYAAHDLLAIEYLDASDKDGIYNKYSGFILGNRIMPRYLNYSPHWMVKSTIHAKNLLMKSRHAEVENYMRTNPHDAWLRKIFMEANITYGRSDYSLVNGEPQLWEINLNPGFVLPPRKRTWDNSEQRMMRDLFYKQFYEALEENDYTSEEEIHLSLSDEDITNMRVSLATRIRRGFHARLMKKKPHYTVMRKLCFAAARLWVRVFSGR